MTAVVARRPATRVPGRRPPTAGAARQLAALAVVAVATGLIGGLGADLGRALIGALALLVLALVAFESRTTALVSTIGFLAVLGFTRRLLIPFVGWSESDPLLLVAPAATLVLLLAARNDRRPPPTLLSALFGFQLLWVFAQITNPSDVGLLTAAKGALLFLGPLLWFFVGRTLDADQHAVVLRTILWSGVPIVAHGLYQTFFSLLPFEFTWLGVANVHPAVIFVRGFNIRPFSTLTSPQEYGVVLSFIAVILWSKWLHREGPSTWLLWALGATNVALFLQGSRSIFVYYLVALVATFALHRRSATGVLLALTIFGAVLLLISSGLDVKVSPQSEEEQESTSAVGALIRHQIEGLLNPTSSTAGLHLEIYGEGLREGLDNPLGLGPSNNRLVSRAEEGETDDPSPENELPITASALGLPAAVALLGIYVSGYVTAFRAYRRRPTAQHLAWFGLLAVAGDQMLNGRLYYASAITALVLGGLATRDTGALLRQDSRPETSPTPYG